MTEKKIALHTSLYMDPTLHREFKVECAKEGMTMQDTLNLIIREWIEKRNK